MVLLQDIAQVLLQFPALEGLRQLSGYRRKLLKQFTLVYPRLRGQLPHRCQHRLKLDPRLLGNRHATPPGTSKVAIALTS